MDIHNTFTFEGEGHQQPGRKPSNLFVSFVLSPLDPRAKDFQLMSRYQRIRNDLLYRHRITLQEAIQCKPVKVPLLDGRQVLLSIDEVITPKTIKIIEGEGMKKYKKHDHMDDISERGDLFVIFEIDFPSKLNTKQRESLQSILSSK